MVSNRSTRSESSAIKGKKNKKTTPRSKSKKSNKSSKPSNTSTSTSLFAFTSNCIDHEKLKKAVKEYKYISPPKTLFERVYLNKFWDMLAEMYPNWLAPNTITLVGYICFGMPVIAAFVAGFTQGDGTCPNWWLLLAWICHFIYQHADGSDGPQARRLKCGSALGELVDHGADAIVTGIFPFAMAEVVGLGMDSPYFLLMYIGGMMAFFTSNMTLLHKQKQEFQDIDAQEAQQAGQMVLFILYCYNVYHGIEGRGLYQNFIIPFPSFVSSDQQIMIVNKLIEYHEYIGLPTTCSIISDVPCFENGSSNGTIGLNFVWLLVTASYFSIWLNAIKLISSLCMYYSQNELPKKTTKGNLVGRGFNNLFSQVISCAIFCILSINAWVLLNGGEVGKRDVKFFLPFFVTVTWSFGDFANHLLIVRVARINFPAFYRHRSWLWLIGLNVAMYIKNYNDGLYIQEAFYFACMITVLAYYSHYEFCSTMGLALSNALGIQFFTVPKRNRN